MKPIEFIKKYFIFILAGATILFALFTLVFMQLQPTPIPSPAPIPFFSPSPTSPSATSSSFIPRPNPDIKYDLSDDEILRRDALVGQLLNKLPYSGTNFSLEYNYSNGQFIATLKTNQEASNKELDDFLKSNQIENRSWLNNLIVRTQ